MLKLLPVVIDRKIALVGPHQAGKTRVANILAQIQTQGQYDPTVGVRIVEFEKNLVVLKNKRESAVVAQVEIWDTSGDIKYAHNTQLCRGNYHRCI